MSKEPVLEQETESGRLPGFWRLVTIVFTAGALILGCLYIFNWRPFGVIITSFRYLYLLLLLLVPVCFIWKPFHGKGPRLKVPWYDVVLIILAVAVPLYLITQEYNILFRGWEQKTPLVPFIFSTLLWVLMLEAGRRAGGPVFAGVILFFSTYPLFASHMPGFLQSLNFSFNHVASFHALGEDSIRGVPFNVYAKLLIGFMVFAVVIQRLGAGKLFVSLAAALVGKTRAGNAKIAIVASGFFASISGSSEANVMTTGAFTIPAMKKEGFPAHFAGGVEASASSGGCVTPPVMGATAFIMSEFIGVPYAQIALAATIPAILFFVCLFAQIDSYAARLGLKPAASLAIDAQPVRKVLLDNLHIVASFISLLVFLFVFRLSSQGPWIASAVAIVLGMLRKDSRLTPRLTLTLLEETGKVLSNLLCVMAPVGLIIGGFVITGLAFTLPYHIMALAGGNVIIMLVLGALVSFILGMGVTTSAVYVFLAIVLAPGLTQAGFDLLATHLFILYTAVWSHITPPVAMAAFTAAGIAGSDPMKTGYAAMKLGIAKYILPVFFIMSPTLILRGAPFQILVDSLTAFAGLVIISAALEGYFWRMGKLTMVSRVMLFAAGLLLALPGMDTIFYGIAIFVVVFGLSKLLPAGIGVRRLLVQT